MAMPKLVRFPDRPTHPTFKSVGEPDNAKIVEFTFCRSPLLREPRRQAMSMLSCPICFL